MITITTKEKLMELHSEKLWPRLIEISRESQFRRATIAYLSCNEDIQFQHGDLLIVNASDNAIQSGATSAFLLEKLLNDGVELYSNDTLHTKMMVFNDYVYLGSANISKNSKNNLIEVGVIISSQEQPLIFEEAQDILSAIKNDERTIQLNLKEIQRLKELPVERKEVIKRDKFKIKKSKRNYWALGTYQRSYDGNIQKIEDQTQILLEDNEEIDWFFFKENHAKKMFKECKENDAVIIFARNGANDPINTAYLVVIIHLFLDENNKKICFYRILKIIEIEQQQSIFNNELASLYNVKWIGRRIKDDEILNVKKHFLESF